MKYNQFNDYEKTFVFDTKIEGPTICIFGGIHGDEVAGLKVIDKLIKDIENNKLTLLKGKLILAYGNLEAINKGVRQINYNMNRIFKYSIINNEKTDLEVKRMKELVDILKKSDILLDIHSTSSESIPFMFSENFKNELEIAKHIGVNKVIVGWEKSGGDLLSGDTNTFMHKLGKIAFTLECGQHKSNNSLDIGYNTVLKLLKYKNIIDLDFENNNKVDLIEMYKTHSTINGNFKFNDFIDNFNYINKGYFIGFDGDQKIYSSEDFIIVLPKYANTKAGEEIFYYGKEIIN